MDKFALDVLGEQRMPTTAERKLLDETAERIHLGNLERAKQPESPIDRDALIAAADEADRHQGIQRQMDYLLKQKRREVAAPKPLNTVTLDGMDLSYVEEEERRKKEPKKDQVTVWGSIPYFEFERLFRNQIEGDMARTFMIPSGFLNPATPKPSTEASKPAPTEKDRRRIQAEQDAKQRMKLASREPVRR